MSTAKNTHVVCVRAEGADDLEVRKVYECLQDEAARADGLLRVVDDSGEDYLYPADWFAPITLPVEAARLFVGASRKGATAPRAEPRLRRSAPGRRR